jgi:hypothetical protein
LTGGSGNNTYRFWDAVNRGSDLINEAASVDVDTLDFFFAPVGVNVNLASTVQQTDIPNLLNLRLSSSTGIENVKGSNSGGDTIRGKSRDNRLDDWGGNDWLYGAAGAEPSRLRRVLVGRLPPGKPPLSPPPKP